MGFNKTYLLQAVLIFLSLNSNAKTGMTVSNSEAVNNPMAVVSAVGATQRSSQNALAIRLRVSCFSTNLRSVSNPVAPNSTITMTGQMKTSSSSSFTDFSLKFPASAVIDTPIGATIQIPTSDLGGALSGAKAGISNNLLSVNLKSTSSSSVDPVTATISQAQAVFQLQNIQFAQSNTDNGGDYMAKDGPLSVGSLTLNQSGDGKTYDIESSFPGQNGYCGGYYSPLMVFFDKERPHFENVVDFDMGHGLKTHWPEKNHAGYFVALPEKNKIKNVNQLFGESKNFNNGFDKLAEFDSNKDGVIDSKDPIYKKLVLWKDTTGTGQFNPKDAIPLHKKIKSIRLKYDSVIETAGKNAEYRERSQVELWTSKNQKQKTAAIIDVWFRPVIEQNYRKPELRKLSSN